MKQQIIAAVLTAATLNTRTITTNARDTTNILSNTNLIQQVSYNGDDLNTATYYQTKSVENTLQLQYATVMIKGYQRLYVDIPNDICRWRTEYYFYIEYNDGNEEDFSYSNITFDLRGFINPNSQISPTYEDYDIFYIDTANNTMLGYMLSDNNTFEQLETVHNLNAWSVSGIPHHEYDTMGTNASLVLNQKHKYLKWEIMWDASEIYDDETNHIKATMIPNMINSLSYVYQTVSGIYTWTFSSSDNYEVLDIPGLLFTIIGMPFAWISTAFNLTIFSGTPYAINFSRLIFEIILGLFLLIVVKKMIK